MNSPRPNDDLQDFRAQCRRQLDRSLHDRIKYGFNLVHKPVLDDAPFRVFASLPEYRAWCHQHLPKYLGFQLAGA